MSRDPILQGSSPHNDLSPDSDLTVILGTSSERLTMSLLWESLLSGLCLAGRQPGSFNQVSSSLIKQWQCAAAFVNVATHWLPCNKIMAHDQCSATFANSKTSVW